MWESCQSPFLGLPMHEKVSMQRMTFVYLGTYICCKVPLVSCIQYQEHVSPPPPPVFQPRNAALVTSCIQNQEDVSQTDALTILAHGLPPSTKTSRPPRKSPLFLFLFFSHPTR